MLTNAVSIKAHCISSSVSGLAVSSAKRGQSAGRLVGKEVVDDVSQFHSSMPQIPVTPLVELSALAKQLGLGALSVKDESQRGPLNAFKILGASYAMARLLSKQFIDSDKTLSYPQLMERRAVFDQHTVVTATDGNHGRGVAYFAQQIGCPCFVYLPKGSKQVRVDAIAQYATQAQTTDYSYDDTVELVKRLAKEHKWQLIQDTAWHGYTQVPDDIMRGYLTLIHEDMGSHKTAWPTHILVQSGVGSLAAGLFAYCWYQFNCHGFPLPKLVLVEPTRAPCAYESIIKNDGNPHQYRKPMDTVMAGLACGLPSLTAWQILFDLADAYLIAEDSVTVAGMRQLAVPVGSDPVIVSGESGAVTLGVLGELMNNEQLQPIKQHLNLTPDARVLLISTEGDTDPDFYHHAVK